MAISQMGKQRAGDVRWLFSNQASRLWAPLVASQVMWAQLHYVKIHMLES